MRQRNVPKSNTINELRPYSCFRHQNTALYIQELCIAVLLLSLCSEEIKLPPHLQFPQFIHCTIPSTKYPSVSIPG